LKEPDQDRNSLAPPITGHPAEPTQNWEQEPEKDVVWNDPPDQAKNNKSGNNRYDPGRYFPAGKIEI